MRITSAFLGIAMLLFGTAYAQVVNPNFNTTQTSVQNQNPNLLGTCAATCTPLNIINPTLTPSPKGGGNNQINNGNGTIATIYQNSACGLSYVLGEVKTGKRYSPAAANQPVTINITGIPPCYQIQKAYLYTGGSGNGLAFSSTLVNPASTSSVFPMTMIGNHLDKCWGYSGTYNYRADVTALISGNGAYVLSGIPTSITTPGNDMDGASLVIIFTDPSQSWEGNIVIGDGCQVNASTTGTLQNTLTGFNSCGNSTFAQCFYIISDLQNILATGCKMNSPAAYNFSYPAASNKWWDNIVGNANMVTTGQNSCLFGTTNTADCYNIVTEGLYWRTNCNVCSAGGLTITTAVTSTCTAGSATAFVSGGNAPYSYTWTPSAANTSVISNVAPGNYTVTVKDATGCLTGTALAVIPASSTTLAVNSATICTGQSATLTATGGNTYTWTPAATLSSANGNPVVATPAATTIYTVSGTNTLGCTGTAFATVTVNAPPVVTVNSPTVCVGSSFTLTAPAGNTMYVWVGPNAFFSALQNPPFANAQTTLNGNYSVTVTSALGCTNTGVGTVSVVPAPTVVVAGTNTLCSQNFNGSQNTTTLTSTGASTYQWTLPPGFNASPNLNSSPIVITPPVTSVPLVATMSVIGTSGSCTNSAVFTLTVLPNPTLATTSGSMCAGTSVNLTASGAQTYTWSPSATLNTANGPNVTASPAVTTVYSIIGSSVGCNSQTGNATANVVNNPTVSIAPLTPTICFGSSINLTASGANNYTWTPNTAISTTVGANVVVSPTVTTTYQIIGEASTCTNSASRTVTVIALPVINIALSSPTMCMNNYNGSVNSITLNASGASSYNWTGFTGVTANTNSGSQIILTAIPNSPVGTGTVVGSVGTCTGGTTFTVISVPNPIISVPSVSMCLGTSVMISASGAQTYQWSPPNDLSATTGSTVMANPAQTTVYSVIGSSVGCQSTTQQTTVDVVALPSIVVAPANPTICAGSAAGLSAFGANNYTWSPANTLNTAFGANVVASPMVTTNYTVIGEAATCTSSAVRQVSVIPLPNLQAITQKSVICAGDQTNINANGASSYTWSPTYGLSNGNSNFVIVSPMASVNYSLIGNNGVCTATLVVPIVVLPQPVLQLSTSSPKICYGAKSTIFAAGAQSYTWDPLPDSTVTTYAVVSPSVNTNYTVTGINYTGTVGCVFTKEILIEVVPTITAVVSASTQICLGESVKLDANGADTYVWSPPAGLSNSLISNPYANPETSTEYTVFVSKEGNCAVKAMVYVQVNPLPVVNAGPDLRYNYDEPMYLSGTGTGTLTWTFGDGILCKVCPNTQFMTAIGGNYKILAVNEFGCKASDELNVEITNEYSIYIPNIFTPNYDEKNETFLVFGVGISNIQVTIFDRWGAELYHDDNQTKGWDGTFKGELCKNDVYVYVVKYIALDGKKHTKTGHVTLMK